MASAVLRHSFHFALVSACQHFIGDVMADDGAAWRRHLAHLLGAVEPASPFEDATLRDALARLAVSAQHSPTFAGRRWVRDFSRAVAAIVGDPAVTAKTAYERWQTAGGARGSTLDRAQLYSIVERSRVEGRRLSAVASEARLNPSTVRKAFRRAYGISPREFRARMQVIRIIERLR